MKPVSFRSSGKNGGEYTISDDFMSRGSNGERFFEFDRKNGILTIYVIKSAAEKIYSARCNSFRSMLDRAREIFCWNINIKTRDGKNYISYSGRFHSCLRDKIVIKFFPADVRKVNRAIDMFVSLNRRAIRIYHAQNHECEQMENKLLPKAA